MTLVEFLAPLQDKTHKERVLALLYFISRYENIEAATVESIRLGLRNARVKGWAKVNVADVLAKSGHYVDSPGAEGARRLWKLTSSGEKYVRDILGLPVNEPEVEHDVGALSKVISTVRDIEVRGYIEEAVKCLQIGALRACIVFLWTGAIRTLQQEMIAHGTSQVTAALQKHDPRVGNISTIDHFAYVKDKTTLLAAQSLGLLDKNEKDTLEEALNLRNRCGHPSKYRPGVKKVSSFIEDVVSILFN